MIATKTKTQKEEVEFLTTHLKKLQKWYELSFEICPNDFPPVSDEMPVTSPDEERAARLADDNGFDGSLFRNLTIDKNPLSPQSTRRKKKQIETIPKIIAEIEIPPEIPSDRATIQDNTELLTIPQVARMLGWSEGAVRERDKKGLLPLPCRFGGTIQWNRQELKDWIDAGCPPRQELEKIKQRKEEM